MSQSPFQCQIPVPDKPVQRKETFDKFAFSTATKPSIPFESLLQLKTRKIRINFNIKARNKIVKGRLRSDFRDYYLNLKNKSNKYCRSERISKILDQKTKEYEFDEFLNGSLKISDIINQEKPAELESTKAQSFRGNQTHYIPGPLKRVNNFQYSFDARIDAEDQKSRQHSRQYGTPNRILSEMKINQEQMSQLFFNSVRRDNDFIVNKYVIPRRLRVGRKRNSNQN